MPGAGVHSEDPCRQSPWAIMRANTDRNSPPGSAHLSSHKRFCDETASSRRAKMLKHGCRPTGGSLWFFRLCKERITLIFHDSMRILTTDIVRAYLRMTRWGCGAYGNASSG